MAFKCFNCAYTHCCSYSQVCNGNNEDCEFLVKECENCRYGAISDDKIICRYHENIVKFLVPDRVCVLFNGDDDSFSQCTIEDFPF